MSTATRAALIPIALGGRCGLVMVCIVKGSAPLLLSRNFIKQLGAVLDTRVSQLHLPDLGLRLALHEAKGEHYMLQLDQFADGWAKPHRWTIRSQEVSVCLAEAQEHKHPSPSSIVSAAPQKDQIRAQMRRVCQELRGGSLWRPNRSRSRDLPPEVRSQLGSHPRRLAAPAARHRQLLPRLNAMCRSRG